MLERGIGYIKVGIDAGTTGSVSGYVDPVGPQGPVEFPAAGQSSTFTGNVRSSTTPAPLLAQVNARTVLIAHHTQGGTQLAAPRRPWPRAGNWEFGSSR